MGLIEKYSSDLNHYFYQFLFCQMIDAMILGGLAFTGLSLIGSRYALLLGSMLAVLNFIPFFGSIFGSMISILVIAITEGLGTALWATIFLVVLQQIDGNLISPKLLESSFNGLHPLQGSTAIDEGAYH